MSARGLYIELEGASVSANFFKRMVGGWSGASPTNSLTYDVEA